MTLTILNVHLVLTNAGFKKAEWHHSTKGSCWQEGFLVDQDKNKIIVEFIVGRSSQQTLPNCAMADLKTEMLGKYQFVLGNTFGHRHVMLDATDNKLKLGPVIFTSTRRY
jgi:hypothetical protein